MALFELLVVLLLAALPLLAAAHALGLPYPALLIGAGALFAAVPFTPQVAVDPKLALVLFVAPALLQSAYQASPRELYGHRASLFMLAIAAVVVTTAAVAACGHAALGLAPAVAIALGAIVAPPDAAATEAVMASAGLPRQGQLLLQGESLLNDASSLLLFGFAVAAATPGQAESGPGALLLAAPGGILLGLAAAWLWVKAAPVFQGSLSFSTADIVVTFSLWLLADACRLSPVLAVVAFGMLLGRHFTRWQPARDRIQSTAVWRALVPASNAIAFLLVGLQVRTILAGMDVDERIRSALFAAVVLGVVVVVRVLWVLVARLVLGALHRSHSRLVPRPMPWAVSVAMGWAGMRGVVTLAAAFSLPDAMPQRGPIVLSAYAVVFGTLVLQGTTLGPLIRWLGIGDDGEVEREVDTVRRTLSSRSPATTKRGQDGVAQPIRARWSRAAGLAARHSAETELALQALGDWRATLDGMRRSGQVTEDAFRTLLEEMDWAEIHFQSAERNALKP